MSTSLRIFLIIAAAGLVTWILGQIRRLKVKMEDAIFWTVFATVIVLMAVFPQIPYKLCGLFGISSPANFVWLLVIGLLAEKIFTLSMQVSLLQEKVSVLSAEIALRSHASDIIDGRLTQQVAEAQLAAEDLQQNAGT